MLYHHLPNWPEDRIRPLMATGPGASRPPSGPRRCGRRRRGVGAVDQVPRAPYGVRGVSDEHQNVDVARRPGVAPGLRAVHHESLEEPAGRLLQPFEVALEPQPLVWFERRGGPAPRPSGRPGPRCRVCRSRRVSLSSSGVRPALRPGDEEVGRGAPARGRLAQAPGQSSHVGHRARPVPDLFDAHVDPALVYRRLQVGVAVDVHAAGRNVVEGHVGEEQVGLARQVGARRHRVERPPEAADVRVVVVPRPRGSCGPVCAEGGRSGRPSGGPW